MEELLGPTQHLTFSFESFIERELGLTLNEKKKPQANICKYFLKGTCRMGNRCQFKHQKNDKTVMCKHWLRGLCKKGDTCEFLHEYNLKKMPECWFYSNYGECSNAECMYLHIDPESKIKECPWYNRGFCKHGPTCRNKHARKNACQAYLTGFCPLGPECPRGHAKHEIPKIDHSHADPVLVNRPGFPQVQPSDPPPQQ
eukprot:Partr_v1_DN27181_c1_g1_i1_m15937 putative Polycomb group ring finger